MCGALAALGALGLPGCGEEVTQALLRVDADDTVRQQVDSVRFQIFAPDGAILRPMPRGLASWPHTLPLEPSESHRGGRFKVLAEAVDSAGCPLAQLRAFANFSEGEQQWLNLRFDPQCVSSIDCGGGASCEQGQCIVGCYAYEPDSSRRSMPTPCAVPCLANQRLGIGVDRSCALTNGLLHCWGAEALRSPSGGACADLTRPQRVAAEGVWTEISVSEWHMCAIREGGELFCWGENRHRVLGVSGDGSSTCCGEPIAVMSATGEEIRHWTDVATGRSHTCAIAEDGGLWCWGAQTCGRLGVSSPEADVCEDPGVGALPMQVGSQTWSAVAAGTRHTCGVRQDGTLWCWGMNTKGQLGVGLPGLDGGGMPYSEAEPQQVILDSSPQPTWRGVQAGTQRTCGRTTDGRMYCWGATEHGVIGIGIDDTLTNSKRTPQFVLDDVAKMASGMSVDREGHHTCAIRTTGALWCWGRNADGQVGTGETTDAYLLPVRVGIASDWQAVSTGPEYTCGVRGEGELFCWGRNHRGQLGLGHRDSVRVPTQVCVNGVEP